MKIVENYLNSLESHLPDDIKQEVREEFGASIYEQIEDRQEALNRELTLDELEEFLVKIGHPMQVAARYLPNQELIGEAYFPAYKKALKLAILIILTIKVLLTLPAIFSGGHIIGSIISLMWSLLHSALWVFAYVTLIFYLMQSNGFDTKHLYAFSAKGLQASNPKLSLNRVDTVIELVFLVLFLAWWNNMFSWIPTEQLNLSFVSATLSSEWQLVFWSVNIILGLDVINGLYKILCGSYNRASLVTDIVLNLASIFIIFQISQFSKFAIIASEKTSKINWEKLEPIINYTVYSILAVVLVICLWDIYHSFKKLRYLPIRTTA